MNKHSKQAGSRQQNSSTRSAFNPRRRKPAKPAPTDHALEEAVIDKLDRESSARIDAAAKVELRPGMFISDESDKQAVVVHAFNDLDLVVYRHADGKLDYSNISAVEVIPHPVAAHDRAAMDEFRERVHGRKFDTEIHPGMAIRDCPGERSGVVWYSFNALDLCVYMDAQGKLHHTRIQDIYIEPRPGGESANFYFPANLYPPEARNREAMKPLEQLNKLFRSISDLLGVMKGIHLPEGMRSFLYKYPASLRDFARAMISECHEFHANLLDEVLGNTEGRELPGVTHVAQDVEREPGDPVAPKEPVKDGRHGDPFLADPFIRMAYDVMELREYIDGKLGEYAAKQVDDARDAVREHLTDANNALSDLSNSLREKWIAGQLGNLKTETVEAAKPAA